MGRVRKYTVDTAELQQIADRARDTPISEAEHGKLKKSIELLGLLTAPSPNNEQTKKILPEEEAGPGQEKPKAQGHGRRKPEDFVAASHVGLQHPELKPSDPCPCGCGGRVYRIKRHLLYRHFVGQPPISVTIYEREQLRCNKCEEVFPAPLPANVGDSPYDPTAVSVIALSKYGTGMPFYRLATFLGALGVPIAAATQYEVVAAAAKKLQPVFEKLTEIAAQGNVVHVDDSGMTILKFMRELNDKRTGLFTTGVVSIHETFKLALFFSGSKHSGENMAELLKLRPANLPALQQMSDALSRNYARGDIGEAEVIDLVCLVHGRRNFVKIVDQFPEECRKVMLAIGAIYEHEREAQNEALGAEARLALHQQKSKPVMDGLHEWLKKQFDEKLVEANSALGKAIQYMLNHWEGLTQFLRVLGAPLDNNICERALKQVVLHRKNSLFYRTANGAKVGDLYMSLIYSCRLNGIDPYHYLTELQRHSELLGKTAGEWMPWNYRNTLKTLDEASD